jgi:hypothetical protein
MCWRVHTPGRHPPTGGTRVKRNPELPLGDCDVELGSLAMVLIVPIRIRTDFFSFHGLSPLQIMDLTT